jgi:hypothetical protein
MKNKTKIKARNYCSVPTIKIGELIDTVIIPQSCLTRFNHFPIMNFLINSYPHCVYF